MSWLFSQALVEEYWRANCSDGAPSAPSSSTLTRRAYLSPDRMTDFSRLSRFGMTFGHLTDALGEAVLTWFLAGFRARTSRSPDAEPESTEHEADSGASSLGSFARYDPATRSLRIHQRSLLEDSTECSPTLPRSGSMRSGACWERPMLAHRTAASGSGYWPTPTANAYGSCQGGSAGRDGQKNRPSLQTMAAKGLWPTPQARDHFPVHKPEYIAKKKAEGHGMSNLNDAIGGSLNPTWVEWLMGWPLGWTDLRPSATARYRNAPPKHGECS